MPGLFSIVTTPPPMLPKVLSATGGALAAAGSSFDSTLSATGNPLAAAGSSLQTLGSAFAEGLFGAQTNQSGTPASSTTPATSTPTTGTTSPGTTPTAPSAPPPTPTPAQTPVPAPAPGPTPAVPVSLVPSPSDPVPTTPAAAAPVQAVVTAQVAQPSSSSSQFQAPPAVAAEIYVPNAAASTEKRTVSDSVRQILDRISLDRAKPKKNKNEDHIRRLAETVRKNVRTEKLVESIGEVVSTPFAEVRAQASLDPVLASGPSATSRPASATTLTMQRQAYRENL